MVCTTVIVRLFKIVTFWHLNIQ